jgi:hypothetical protein
MRKPILGCGLWFMIVLVIVVIAVAGVLRSIGISERLLLRDEIIAIFIIMIIGYIIHDFMNRSTVRDEISCPYCGEAILRVAKKCKHCGSMLK